MSRIHIEEPSEPVRALLEHVVGRMGHELTGRGDDPLECDLLILEASSSSGLLVATRLRAAQPDLPIICISSEQLSSAVRELGPIAHFVKPFAIAEIEEAVTNALLFRG
ncbi:MAG: two-component system, cell cycle response regulator CpdR [Gaiellaceae bacterium]|jgi:DNA-binding response OmpR family regulator|nr:two-component system, cell cycle response regulator CpdR [Gaiellaceae bacterium]MDX6468683.1 two-component system, cell cycle response regulator CpdR [Gaiellaceae bacterium]MDX6471299.1 two-component system, cell cycle response regulator CpdR [Gaiellaceae bacterium]